MLIEEILDMMDDILDEAAAVPFSSKKSVIDTEKMRNCINDLRLNMPDQIKDAKNIVRDRKEIIDDANKEAEQIVKRAEERAKMIISNDEITKEAKQRGTEMLTSAQTKAKEIKSASNKYIDDILLQTEECLQASLADIRKTRQAVRSFPNNSTPNASNAVKPNVNIKK